MAHYEQDYKEVMRQILEKITAQIGVDVYKRQISVTGKRKRQIQKQTVCYPYVTHWTLHRNSF